MNRFFVAAADWLGASEVRVVDAAADDGSPDGGPVTAAAQEWLAQGASAEQATRYVGAEQLDFAAIRGRDGAVHAALVVRRARRPRPPGTLERITAVAELVSRVRYADLPISDAQRDSERADIGAASRERLITNLAAAPAAAAAFVVGVDRLVVVNEVLGGAAGDAMLRTVADRLEQWAAPAGAVARLSGTRFGVTRPDLDAADATAAAYDLRELLAAPMTVSGLPVSRSVSVGVAVGPAADAPQVLRQAVRGSLLAREAGGDAVRSPDAQSMDERLGRLQLELELDNALRTGQLRLHYQPEFDLRTGHLLAVEALLRWQHPRLGLVRADAFVDDTERSRTFSAVQLWVIDEAVRQLAAWQQLPNGRGLGLRINVSAWQIARGEVADGLLSTIERNGVATEDICIELTERRMPRRLDRIADGLRLLTGRGLSVAIDDFGTGQGTLSQLIRLPVDTIKIDQSFVVAMREDPRAAAAVTGVIALARSLSLETVAEGVDGPQTAASLVQLGCTRGQGNSLGAAMPPAQVEQLLRSQVLV